MNLEKRIILISVISCLLILSLVFFGIYPLLKKINQSFLEREKIKGEFSYLQKRSETIKAVEEKYNKFLSEDIEKINNVFVDSDAPIDFIKFLERTALESNILITVSPFIITQKEDDPWDSMGFQISISSSFVNFFEFLERIEKSFYLLEVQNLIIQKEKDKENQIVATILIKVFSKP